MLTEAKINQELVELGELSAVTTKNHSFKNPNRVAPPRRYKACRQLITDEYKYLQTKNNISFDTPTYLSISAPPSLKPQKKYCDITGLPGIYKSPSSGLRYHDAEIYQEVIKNMPSGLDQEYLGLRGANVVLK